MATTKLTTVEAANPWPIYSTHPHCTGGCDDGARVCMTPETCSTGFAPTDEYFHWQRPKTPREPMTSFDRIWLLASCTLSLFVVWLLAMGTWPLLQAAGRIIRGWLS